MFRSKGFKKYILEDISIINELISDIGEQPLAMLGLLEI